MAYGSVIVLYLLFNYSAVFRFMPDQIEDL
jgi:hypothetical protein